MASEQSGGTSVSPPAANIPPQATMGLLNFITATSMDEDYAEVAHRQGSRGEAKTPSAGLAALVILGLFGLLVTVAGVQTSRNAISADNGHQQLVTQIKARSAQVDARRSRIAQLQEEVDRLRGQYLDTTAQGRQLRSQLSRLGVRTGSLAVTGPGVKVVADDAPNATSSKQEVLDEDLQRLANALWASGAEAISINGQRLTNLSAIRQAGSAITVNGRSLSAPFTVLAIGDPDSIPARFVETTSGSAWLDLQVAWGLQLSMTTEESLNVPAASRLELRDATRIGGRR